VSEVINVNRVFKDVDFAHTESVVNYNESYSFSGPDMKQLNDTKEITFNHVGLSVW